MKGLLEANWLGVVVVVPLLLLLLAADLAGLVRPKDGRDGWGSSVRTVRGIRIAIAVLFVVFASVVVMRFAVLPG